MSEESKESQVPENKEENQVPENKDVDNEKGASEDRKKEGASDYQKIRSQFDNVLHKHIIRLIEIETESTLKFDTSTVACLVLLVERDREIKNFPKSPPARYTRDTFLGDLSDIGLEIDDDLMSAFETLVKLGYVGIDKDENYCALISTLALVKFIDNLFSGMPGLNLIAYIIQCIDEILGGRKELKEHLKNFEQTLVARGVSISKQDLKEEEKETIKKTATTFKVSKDLLYAAEKLKKANVQKLASMRTKAFKTDAAPKYVSVSSSEVKELFPKTGDIQEEEAVVDADEAAEQAALELEKKQAELQRREAELKKAEEASMALERKKAEIETREAEIREAELKAREAEIAAKEAALKASEIAAKEAEMAAKEAELKAMEAQLKSQADDDAGEDITDAEASAPDHAVPDDPEQEQEMSIEEKIAAFEAELAMPCPICTIGTIANSTTDKGKEYYACTNTSCKFVSWSKPYPFACPLCKNPYLVEFMGEGGAPGLKCPRAVCAYTQAGLAPPQAVPSQGGASAAEGGGVVKKKKRIVRRRKR